MIPLNPRILAPSAAVGPIPRSSRSRARPMCSVPWVP